MNVCIAVVMISHGGEDAHSDPLPIVDAMRLEIATAQSNFNAEETL